MPLSSTQDIGGPIARSIADLAVLLDATVGADPADPSTAVSAGHIPASYRSALEPDALKGARIGVLRSLFGTAPEDQEVAGIVLKAIEALKSSGAEVIDVTIPGLDDLMRDSSMIDADFKFDLADYLAAAPERAGAIAWGDPRSRAGAHGTRRPAACAKRGRGERKQRGRAGHASSAPRSGRL